VVLTPSVPVSNWLVYLRPRVRLFICLLQGICTPGVVRLRRVATCITSGVYERVHSISRRTLYYIRLQQPQQPQWPRQPHYIKKITDPDDWIIPGTKITNNGPFLWNG
jgi:hypothetical protein